MSIHNPNCDGGHCTQSAGEVRLLPIGSDPLQGNLILCRECFGREIRYREGRNKRLSIDCKYDLPAWEDLKVYGSEDPQPAAPLTKEQVQEIVRSELASNFESMLRDALEQSHGVQMDLTEMMDRWNLNKNR